MNTQSASEWTAWMSDPQYLAQAAHFLGAVGVIVTATLFSVVLHAGWAPIMWTLGTGIVLVTVKEFIVDINTAWGEGDSWLDSLMDWSFYMLGGGIGMGLAELAHRVSKVGW